MEGGRNGLPGKLAPSHAMEVFTKELAFVTVQHHSSMVVGVQVVPLNTKLATKSCAMVICFVGLIKWVKC